jgi:sugar-specific transcriptional regulator TrmB
MELIDSLNKFGLSEKEAKVYLACLELGNSLASEISLKSNLPRTLIYDLLERLIDLGLISYTIRENKKYFMASSPKELIRIIREKEEAVRKTLPQLEAIEKAKGLKRPKVEIYEGKEGMKTVMDDILRANIKELLSYGSSRSSFEIIPAFMEDWHKRRIKKKITMKVMYNNTPEAREKVKTRIESLKYGKYRFMPIEVNFPTATIIYGNKVVQQSWTKDPFAVVIESEALAENQKRYFQELWKLAKP